MPDAPTLLLVLFGVAMVASSIGFKHTVWFISLGYTASIALSALVAAGAGLPDLAPTAAVQLALLFVWATRLGWFLFLRERKTDYQNANSEQIQRAEALGPLKRAGIWVSVSLLYVCMFSPAVFTTVAGAPATVPAWIATAVGLALMALGVGLEAVADHQKSAFKAQHPGRFVDTGLYAWVRCPNYLGEILVWIGSFVAGAAAMTAWWHPVVALIGLVCIVLIMMGSTKRLEAKHDARYGEDPAFQRYKTTVPVLLPWVPIYSLKSVRVYLE